MHGLAEIAVYGNIIKSFKTHQNIPILSSNLQEEIGSSFFEAFGRSAVVVVVVVSVYGCCQRSAKAEAAVIIVITIFHVLFDKISLRNLQLRQNQHHGQTLKKFLGMKKKEYLM